MKNPVLIIIVVILLGLGIFYLNSKNAHVKGGHPHGNDTHAH